MKYVIAKLIDGRDLHETEIMRAMNLIIEGEVTPAQIGSFMTALRIKGESIAEITGAAKSMRQKSTRIDVRSQVVMDTCGTGGDQSGTFNISTTVAFVVASAGVVVAKHGNRSVSSDCGSADVLEKLGVNIFADPDVVEECLQQIGIGFLFAPKLHSAMKHVSDARQEIGVRTLFNMLGPLSNPAGTKYQLLGVYDPALTEIFAGVLKNLGSQKAFVVHGLDGLDEISICAPTRISELKDGLIRTYNFDPSQVFQQTYSLEEIKGGDASQNAEILIDVLSGKQGPHRDIVLLNSAFALMAAEKVSTLADAIQFSEKCIDEGFSKQKLMDIIQYSNM